jgi:predicted HTH domain antitoxin
MVTKTTNDIITEALSIDPEFRFMVAGKLYDSGKLTQGEAAELAQMSRIDFIENLGKHGFHAMNSRGVEVDLEIQTIKEITNDKNMGV